MEIKMEYVNRKELAAECGRTRRTLYNYLHRDGVKELLLSKGVNVDVNRDFNPQEANVLREFLGIVEK